MLQLFRQQKPSVAASKLADVEKCETQVYLKSRTGVKTSSHLAKKAAEGNRRHDAHHNNVMAIKSAQQPQPSLALLLLKLAAAALLIGVVLWMQ